MDDSSLFFCTSSILGILELAHRTNLVQANVHCAIICIYDCSSPESKEISCRMKGFIGVRGLWSLKSDMISYFKLKTAV